MDNENEQPRYEVVATGKVARPFTFTTSDVVWGDLLKLGNEEAGADVVKAISKEITAVYSGTYESGEDVSITPTAKWANNVAELFNSLGLEVSLDELPVPEKGTRTTSTERVKVEKAPTFCLFSGLPTSGGKFRPGYDMRLRGALTKIIDNVNVTDETVVAVGQEDGGADGTGHFVDYTLASATAKLIELGWYSEVELRERRRAAFANVEKKAAAAAQREADKARLKAEKEKAKADAASAPVTIEDPVEDVA